MAELETTVLKVELGVALAELETAGQ